MNRVEELFFYRLNIYMEKLSEWMYYKRNIKKSFVVVVILCNFEGFWFIYVMFVFNKF